MMFCQVSEVPQLVNSFKDYGPVWMLVAVLLSAMMGIFWLFVSGIRYGLRVLFDPDPITNTGHPRFGQPKGLAWPWVEQHLLQFQRMADIMESMREDRLQQREEKKELIRAIREMTEAHEKRMDQYHNDLKTLLERHKIPLVS